MTKETLSNLLQENRRFDPPPELAAHANVTADAYAEADADRLAFWAKAAERLDWDEPWTEVLDWSKPPFAKWFVGGKLNVADNCVDRHVAAGKGDKVAYYWEGEPGDQRTITYADLKDEVCRAANALTELGVEKGDRVAIYMPMIPETVVAMLACARLGAPHTVVFGGFSSDALSTRILDCDAHLVITADGGYRRGNASALKPAVDEALKSCPDVRNVLVVRRTGQDVDWTEGRDVWWHDVVDRQSNEHTPEAHDAEHPLYVMYTSGTTAKPKGILHTTGGYLTGVSYTHYEVFDLKPDTDVFWTAADIGWVTGHSYIVYGPLANGATSVMYEGTPDTPHRGRWWEIVDKYKVSILYCAPTAIRTFMKWGEDIPAKYDLSSLRLLGSVGEPINPEAYVWYREYIGGGRCPVVDTWWQTETGVDHDQPAARRHRGQARRGHEGAARHRGRRGGRPGAERPQRRRRLPGPEGAVAVDAPDHLGRRRAVHRDVLVPVRGDVLRRRRGQEGRGRRPVAAGPGRRRDARLRAQHLHHRGRIGPGVAPEGGRGGRGRRHRPDHRAGHRGLRDPARRRGRGRRRTGRRAAQPRGERARGRSPGRGRSWSCRSCPRPGPARSCGGC